MEKTNNNQNESKYKTRKQNQQNQQTSQREEDRKGEPNEDGSQKQLIAKEVHGNKASRNDGE